MKKIVIIMTVLFAIGTNNIFAQDAKGKKDNFAWQKNYMDSAGISAEVQAKIEVIKKEYEPKTKAIRKDKALTEDAKKAQMKVLNKEKATAIEALLTKEQKATIKAIKEKLKKDNGEG
jgi:hypothetical protein